MNLPPLIHEQFILARAAPEDMDALWATGWRHFGRQFFRYSVTFTELGKWQRIVPLRIHLAEFQPSRGQRRILKRNADVTIEIGPAAVNAEREALFLRHRERFTENIPDSLRIFLPESDPARVPCECVELRMRDATGALLAVSYLDLGAEAASSVYAMFEPSAAARSPGIYTMLREIEYARDTGRRFLYPGYATLEPSHYDYKKNFAALQGYDWRLRSWRPLEEISY